MHDQSRPRRLTRSADKKLGGVCGGLAEYFGVDPTLVRVGFVLLAIVTVGPVGLLLYGLLWAIMPAPDPNAPVPAVRNENGTLIIGLLLVVVGVAMAFEGLHVFWWMTSSIMRIGWPLLLIGAGVLIVIASRRR